ncbi:hypothetical protein F4806DRAFT_503813, partial [Annulohypoxylon nitens]
RADSEFDDRPVDTAAVHYQWFKASSTIHDFAVLHVPLPLPRGINRMAYCKTPSFTGSIRVYGFSQDMPKDENGKTMVHLCFSHSSVQYTIGETRLYHHGDTGPGISGGPVVNTSGAMIAVHRGGGPETNKAVVINHHSNDVDNFVNILASMAGKEPVNPPITKSDEFELEHMTAVCFSW